MKMENAGIVAFAFGAPHNIQSNRWIAEIASLKARELRAPVYTQADVCDVGSGIPVEYMPEESDNPPTTLRMARGAVAWAQQNKLTTLWVSAARPHLWRCVRDLKYAICEAKAQIVVRVCKEIERYSENEWYCSDSTQPRVRSRKEWRKREHVLEMMPMFLYKRVAS
jgi:hypothetical protein